MSEFHNNFKFFSPTFIRLVRKVLPPKFTQNLRHKFVCNATFRDEVFENNAAVLWYCCENFEITQRWNESYACLNIFKRQFMYH